MVRQRRGEPREPSLFDDPAREDPVEDGADAPAEARGGRRHARRGQGGAERARARPRGASPEPDARPPADEPAALSVSELTARIEDALGGFGALRVEGELSRMKRASSGHVYFDLKDERARISCVVWRSQLGRAVRFEPEEGMQVVATGRLDVYAPRGAYSLVVDRLEPVGVGALLARLERLKEELRGLGWFDRHRPLPRFPRRVGVVTSRDGAALRDFLRTRSLRWPGYPLRLCHAAVQGPGAAREIAGAISALERSGVDVIVVCRGGGSLEDLWAFNERAVAEAIRAARVPVVSGVGHESDVTLADLVADRRAHTPTDAAQTVLPDQAALLDALAGRGRALSRAFGTAWNLRADALGRLASRPVLRDAGWILDERERLRAALGTRLSGAARGRAVPAENALRGLATRLERQSPRSRVERWMGRVLRAHERLRGCGRRALETSEHRLRAGAGKLDAISPLRVLARGYSVTRRVGYDAPLSDAGEVAVGDELETRLARGRLRSRVDAVEPGPSAGDGSA